MKKISSPVLNVKAILASTKVAIRKDHTCRSCGTLIKKGEHSAHRDNGFLVSHDMIFRGEKYFQEDGWNCEHCAVQQIYYQKMLQWHNQLLSKFYGMWGTHFQGRYE